MSAVPQASPVRRAIPPALWRRVAAARHRLLMLDYDGTLAPFRCDPLEATPAPGALALLDAVAHRPRTTLAVVSGRPLPELNALIGSAPVVRVAEHGWEVLWPDGRRLVHAVPLAAARALADAAMSADRSLRSGTIERKRTGVVLHTRGLDAATARVTEIACRALWAPLTERQGLRLDRIDGGIELRAVGRDKGDVVRWLLATTPPDTLPVYIGDDITDEDAFRVVVGRGFAIRVGRSDRPSAAALRLASPEDVVAFLEEWSDRTDRARPPAGRIR